MNDNLNEKDAILDIESKSISLEELESRLLGLMDELEELKKCDNEASVLEFAEEMPLRTDAVNVPLSSKDNVEADGFKELDSEKALAKGDFEFKLNDFDDGEKSFDSIEEIGAGESITEYIDDHISEGVTVEEIARECRMSYSYFAKKFLQVYGKTCKEYIEEIRLYKVEELLLYTDFELTYISNETGYSDCSHMIKSFKKYKGVTPKRFRTEKRAGINT